ncbi:hypothetical protein PPL_06130 [Heterostelium album PN500]|uniref:BD-FAE-like domain-containing protein n=1 Tax=Heterostelium pallidum (strain ATCC 26659 / Pp 5 / PN500) TaxID=670386 RepID=D3BCA5_HETP5|nr:hypothetical protein PPL_06130 [Heterostelium album PN500]EFA80895.1 hypothetical protein PPL_06130 [Heterostelium album PN500]|eukprot:XP_020433014.1 hypothetical protein PPL_06130 [Heterostelium album PN500]
MEKVVGKLIYLYNIFQIMSTPTVIHDLQFLYSQVSFVLGIMVSFIYLSLSLCATIAAVFGANKGPLSKNTFVVRFGFIPGVIGSELSLHFVLLMSLITVICWKVNLFVYFIPRLGLFIMTVSSCFLIKTYFGGFKTAAPAKRVMDAFCGVPANQNFQKKPFSFSNILVSIRSFQQRTFQAVESFVMSFRKQKIHQHSSSTLGDPNPLSFGFWFKMLFFLPKLHFPNVQRIRDIPYGEHSLQAIDIYFHNTCPTSRPILVYVHGGGWRENSGTRANSGLPFIYQMANQKWIVFSIGYRLSPTHKFPTHIQDVKRAITWVRENAIHYGGDIDCMFIAGGSAGGHLATLASLTDGKDFEEFSKGAAAGNSQGVSQLPPQIDNLINQFNNEINSNSNNEQQNTANQAININMNSLKLVDNKPRKSYPPFRACISMYAVYDFTNRNNTFVVDFPAYLSWKNIMPAAYKEIPDLYGMCSPIDQIPSETSTQYFILHGDFDELVPMEESLYFIKRFKETVKNPNITWLEIPGGHHAFDAIYSPRTIYTVHAMYRYLNRVYRQHISDRLQQRKQRQLRERKNLLSLSASSLPTSANHHVISQQQQQQQSSQPNINQPIYQHQQQQLINYNLTNNTDNSLNGQGSIASIASSTSIAQPIPIEHIGK